ncbi:MAG: adenylosuccinate synthase [Planctomycetota bacterium]|nr:adenylosuccinate synthase [Planctomycetota bacterium]MDA1105047.1 adenylosuccinate synthase [Planctomycetota bacterium]
MPRNSASACSPTSQTSGHTAVVGLQWGDEGKGKIVDVLTARHDVIVRYNGGANAGHTVVAEGQKYALHLIPSGILYPEKTCVIGNGTVVDPEKVIDEMEKLRARGIRVDGTNLKISDRAHVVMPWHKEQDAALEEYLSSVTAGQRGSLAIGTTRRGIGPAYSDKVRRSTAIRMRDLLDPEYLRERLRVICKLRSAELEALGVKAQPLDPDAVTDRYAAIGMQLAPHITDTVFALHDAIAEGKSLLFEGANAALLDIDHGTYPYVTSSNCSALGIPAGTGVPGCHIHRVLGIMKAYSTRVGGGPFPTELLDETGDRIRERGREYGTTTGRPRRCGWLDLVAVRYSTMLCGATGVACTLFDVLAGFEELKVCVAYRRPDGSMTDRFIPDARGLEGIEPVYETLPGWPESSTPAANRNALPANARAYLERVEAYLGVPIEMVGIGPDRAQTLVREPVGCG